MTSGSILFKKKQLVGKGTSDVNFVKNKNSSTIEKLYRTMVLVLYIHPTYNVRTTYEPVYKE